MSEERALEQSKSELPLVINPDGMELLDGTPYVRAGGADWPIDQTFFQSVRLALRKDALEKPYSQNPTVFACVQAQALPLSQVPFRIYKQSAKKAPVLNARIDAIRAAVPRLSPEQVESVAMHAHPRERMRALRTIKPRLSPRVLLKAVEEEATMVETGPWYELFRSPNPEMTKSQLWEATFIHLGTDGWLFWTFDGLDGPIKKESEIPKELWVYGPKGWKPEIDKKRKVIAKWIHEWTMDGKPQKDVRELWQLTAWRRYNPYSATEGLSPLDAVKLELEQDWRALLFNLAFFTNGAHPGGYLISEKKLTPEQRTKLLEQFEQRHQGQGKAWRPTILSGGMTFIEAKMSHRDMDFQATRADVEQRVRSVYRTSKTALGIAEDVNRATARVMKRQHWEDVLIPQATYAEDLLDSRLFTEARAGNAIWGCFDFSTVEALREDLADRVEVAKILATVGWTPRDINNRLELGGEEKPWWDTWYRPMNVVPVNGLEEKAEPVVPPPGKPPVDPAAEAEPDPEDPAEPDEPADSETESVRRNAALQEIRESLLLPNEERFERRVRGYLYKLRQEQVGLIERAAWDKVTVPDQVLFVLEPWKERFKKRMGPLFKTAIDETLAYSLKELETLGYKAVRTADSAEFEMFAEELSVHIAKSVATIRAELRRLLGEAISEGKTRAQALAMVRNLFTRLLRRGRVKLIAGYATGAAVSGSRARLWRQKNVQNAEWLTAEDEFVRANHVTYGQGGPHPLGFNWATLVGAVYILEYPHDTRAPKDETINCRCVQVPVPMS